MSDIMSVWVCSGLTSTRSETPPRNVLLSALVIIITGACHDQWVHRSCVSAVY